ncbi:MAG: hypothetical protein ACLR0F_20740 [Eisenbergiella sp.]
MIPGTLSFGKGEQEQALQAAFELGNDEISGIIEPQEAMKSSNVSAPLTGKKPTGIS